MSTPTTTSYQNRQVDLELLQSIATPSADAQQVTISNLNQTARAVTGIEKTIQRYAQLLLTTQGDIYFAKTLGGYLLASVMQGSVGDRGALTHLFCVVSANAVRIMSSDDTDTALYGSQPTDEQIVSAELISLDLSPATLTISLSVQITTAAGSSYTFVVPISTAG